MEPAIGGGPSHRNVPHLVLHKAARLYLESGNVISFIPMHVMLLWGKKVYYCGTIRRSRLIKLWWLYITVLRIPVAHVIFEGYRVCSRDAHVRVMRMFA